jgi:predicted lactoylglutathione lyase
VDVAGTIIVVMKSAARLSLVTLGVRDVARSTEFYIALGFPLSKASVPGDVSFFNTAGGLLAVWGGKDLAADANVPSGDPGNRRFALAMNLDSREEVDAFLALAVTTGARLTRPALATDWGGYNGYFADLDGHLWEIAYNPYWPIGEDGRPTLP